MNQRLIDDQIHLIFLHLPKTGGTSLHHHFSQAFEPHLICPERFSRLDSLPQEELSQYRYFSGHYTFAQVSLIPETRYLVTVLRDPIERVVSNYYFWRRHRHTVVEGLDLLGPRIARSGSLLSFLQSPHPVVRDSSDNQVARFLAGQVDPAPDGGFSLRNSDFQRPISRSEIVERALHNLRKFETIGFTEDLQGVYARVASDWGFPPVEDIVRLNERATVDENFEAVQDECFTAEIVSLLYRFTELDQIVYETALAARPARDT